MIKDKKYNHKKLLGTLTLLVALGLLTACGSGASESSDDPVKKAPPVSGEEGNKWDEMHWDKGTWG